MRIRGLTCCVIAAGILLSAALAYAGCCTEDRVMCGPNCLLAVCNKLGVKADVAELAKLAGMDEKGTTMAGLYSAVKQKGLYGVGLKIGMAEIAKLKVPAIAHLWGSHFVVVEGADANNLLVTDPPESPKLVTKDRFAQAYSGYALLIAKDANAFPRIETNGPDVRFDSLTYEIGSVNAGQFVSYKARLKNVGNEELVISKVEASCSCLLPVSWSSNVEPGGTGEIALVFDSNGQNAYVEKTLYVTSNDPVTPIAQVGVISYVRSERLVFRPTDIYFGEMRRTQAASRDVYVPSIPEEPIRVESISCDSPFVSAELSSSKDKNHPGYRIKVSLRPDAPIGDLNANVTILSDHHKQPKAEIPITATIKGNIDLDHDMFFLGLVKQGKGSTSDVTLSTISKDPLKIGKIDNPIDCITVEVKPKTDGKEYILTAILKPDAPLGNIKGDITVHTNDPDQPEIKIPVYAYIEQ